MMSISVAMPTVSTNKYLYHCFHNVNGVACGMDSSQRAASGQRPDKNSGVFGMALHAVLSPKIAPP